MKLRQNQKRTLIKLMNIVKWDQQIEFTEDVFHQRQIKKKNGF